MTTSNSGTNDVSASSPAPNSGPSREARFKAWRDAGRHLPAELRDFHDQKAVFRAMHELQPPALGSRSAIRQPTWVEGHCYVIDQFLWFMASHGYALQRSRADLPFASLSQTVQEAEARRQQALAQVLKAPLDSEVATPDSRSAPQS